MASYGLRYQGEYANVPTGGSERTYTVQVLQKDYSGSFQSIVLAATPVVHKYQTDDIRSPVRGSSATINIINSGSIPITTFYSLNDDQWQVKILQGATVLFIGFIVQDDTTEVMLDTPHELTLQCNDGLGLLKGVAFNLNSDVIADPYARNTLSAIIHQCLNNTSLALETYVYVNIWEDRMSEADSPFAQCYIDCNMFISGTKNEASGTVSNVFTNCYDVLEKILDRFNCSLFQALGRWNIVRWDELYTLTTVHAFIYDSTWNLTGSGLLDTPFIAQPNIATASIPATFPETGLRRQIIRPFQFDRETFNYVQPKYLLKNFDLQTLGALIRTYSQPPNQVSEYQFTSWSGGWGTNPTTRFIRVVVDAIGNEVERYAVLTGTTDDAITGAPRAVQGTPFEATAGDLIKYSFSFRQSSVHAGGVTYFFALRLYNGVDDRYVGNAADFAYVAGGEPWVPALNNAPPHGFFYTIPAGDNTGQWHTVEIVSARLPFDGLIYCYLGQNDGNPFPLQVHETHYKDIRVEYTQFINESTKITGHIHKDTQTDPLALACKNNEDVQIYVDDSPSQQAVGTLFLSTFHNLVQDRTKRWHRAGYTESLRLGQIMTTETLQWRSVPRTKLEGTFYGLVQSAIHVNMTSIFEFSYLGGTRFIFGQFEFDSRENKWHGTAWELDSGTGTVAQIYTFTYIYSTAI